MVDGASIAIDRPLQRVPRNGGRKLKAVADSRLDLSGLFVVVPSDQLQRGQLLPGVVEAVDFRKCLQPRLSALLAHNPPGAPGRQRIVETLVRRTDRLLVGKLQSGVIKTRQIAHTVVGSCGHHPGIAAIAQHVSESATVLKKKNWLGG